MTIRSAAALAAAVLLLLLPPGAVFAQTNVGCDASCPPLGYESDSSHLCPGDVVDAAASYRAHEVCHPLPPPGASSPARLSFESFRRPGSVTVIANYYTGCEAGRRESGVYAGVAQRVHDETEGRVNFVTSLKGGGDCATWAGLYQRDAESMGLVAPSTMPLTVEDRSYDLRDRFFTPPYPHPSYIILDENLEVTYKGVGPCCGYVSYFACTNDVALELDGMLTDKIYEVYNKQMAAVGAEVPSVVDTIADSPTAGPSAAFAAVTTGRPTNSPSGNPSNGVCRSEAFSEWSSCSKLCGDGGFHFRHRAHPERPVETRPCPVEIASFLPACSEQCVPEFGREYDASVVASGLDSPRDLAFHPTPGVHLGTQSEGRTFRPDEGEELWVANGFNHSVSIIASLGTEYQTTISRLDRGYYHYMNNITALAFNTVRDSGRMADQDTFNYFAVCNDNLNDYAGSKKPNYFMGPTLYDSDTANKVGRKNTVNRIGEDCSDPADQCFFLHADMLHESPACIGITHDPEVETAYGAVYWAFDTTGDNSGDVGQLVRFDFSQPHGPGSMDHSIAVVRRYPEVKLYRGEGYAHGRHAGMVVHPQKRILYISNPGKGSVVAVYIDTGRYSRTAREEYPIFSNRLPSFEYSIYECVEQDETFAAGLNGPSGLALSLDGKRLFVAEHGGRIVALDTDSGEFLQTINLQALGYTSIGGLAVSPVSGDLYFVDMNSNRVVRITAASSINGECVNQSPVDTNFFSALEEARNTVDFECGEGVFSLTRDHSCQVDGSIPNGTLFEQVHTDTGYASDNPDVQSMAGMDEAAAILANRTDCQYNSELNLDALLLGGYYCHVCLPRNNGSTCDAGGICANVQWQGFTCSNEYYVDYVTEGGEASLVISSLHFDTTYPKGSPLELSKGVTYRFTIRTGAGRPVSIAHLPELPASASLTAESSVKSLFGENRGVIQGPILLSVDDSTPDCLCLTSPAVQPVVLAVGGAKHCHDIKAVAPGKETNDNTDGMRMDDAEEDNGDTGYDLLPKPPSSGGCALANLYISALLCITLIVTTY